MKRLTKRVLKALWRRTSFIHRPLIERYQAMIVRCCASVRPVHVCHVTPETNLLMDHLVRELFRLQTQVEQLQLSVEDLGHARGGLSVVGESSPRSAAG